MIIIDEKENIKNQKNFNAKTAAYIGFSLFGSNHFYLLKMEKSIIKVSILSSKNLLQINFLYLDLQVRFFFNL